LSGQNATHMTPTVALMLKAPRLGHAKTRLATAIGGAVAAEVYRHLAERQLAALPPDWCVAIHFAPASAEAEMMSWMGPLRPYLRFVAQCAGGMGERLTEAFATEFKLGSGGVLVIGGDCPALDRKILNAAADALKAADAVLGPALDGGYYLIGLKKPRPELFKGIDWSTPAVLDQTRAKIRAFNLRLAMLPILEDVDDSESLMRAVSTFPLLGELVAGKARSRV
jgi:rSAM/selenodomain-associated transferase 1